MREIKQKIYTYKELNEKAKKRAIEDYREQYQEMANDDFYEYFKHRLQDEGFKDLLPYYSLSYCKGDGCSVNGAIYLDEILNNKNIIKEFNKNEIRRLNYIYNCFDYKIRIYSNSNLYYHVNTMNFNSIVYIHRQGNYNKLFEVFDKLENVLKDYFINICGEMEDIGYDMIYNDENIEADLIDCEYEFFENGEIF